MSTEAALRCIQEKMDLVDLEAGPLDSVAVTQVHFTSGMEQCNASTLREKVEEMPVSLPSELRNGSMTPMGCCMKFGKLEAVVQMTGTWSIRVLQLRHEDGLAE